MTARRRMFPRSAWYGMAAVLALAAALLAACSEGQADVTPGQTAATSSPPNGNSTEQTGTDLIASTDSAFAVTFKWEEPTLDQHGFLVWRQGKGMRRWDSVNIKDGEVVGGSISLQTNLSPGDIWGRFSLNCLWVTGKSAPITRNSPPGQAFVGCGPGEAAISTPIEDALLADIGSSLDDRMIAGRSARCYSLDDWRFAAVRLCVDASGGIPLLLVTEYADGYSQSMEAISVSTAEQDVPVPLGLEADPVNGFPSYQGMVAMSHLGLPDLPELQQ